MKLTLPPELAESQIFRRGGLFKMTVQFEDGTSREKYGIVVTADHTRDPVFLVLTTSKMKWYDANPKATGFIRLAAGEVQSLGKETVVTCRQLHPVPRAAFMERYQGKTIEFCEQIPPAILAKIDAAIERSVTLSAAEKALVLPKK